MVLSLRHAVRRFRFHMVVLYFLPPPNPAPVRTKPLLSVEEPSTAVRALVPLFRGLDDNWNAVIEAIPQADRDKVIDVKPSKDEMEHIEAAALQDYMEHVNQVQKEAIESVKKGKNADIDGYYRVAREYTRMVAKDYCEAFILTGKALS